MRSTESIHKQQNEWGAPKATLVFGLTLMERSRSISFSWWHDAAQTTPEVKQHAQVTGLIRNELKRDLETLR